jgi:hypothetical protein
MAVELDIYGFNYAYIRLKLLSLVGGKKKKKDPNSNRFSVSNCFSNSFLNRSIYNNLST